VGGGGGGGERGKDGHGTSCYFLPYPSTKFLNSPFLFTSGGITPQKQIGFGL